MLIGIVYQESNLCGMLIGESVISGNRDDFSVWPLTELGDIGEQDEPQDGWPGACGVPPSPAWRSPVWWCLCC